MLVLERVVQLVRERRFRVRPIQVRGHVHRAVGRLVEAGELRVEELKRLGQVVERGGDEPEHLELEPLVRDRARRDLALEVRLHLGQQRVAREDRPGNRPERREPARLGDALQHLGDPAILARVRGRRSAIGGRIRGRARGIGRSTGVRRARDHGGPRALWRGARTTSDASEEQSPPHPRAHARHRLAPASASRRIAPIACA